VEDRPDAHIPQTFVLHQNFPNPFNSSTIISFTVPENHPSALVVLKIYNVRGQLVKELMRHECTPGNYLTKWDGTTQEGIPVTSGTYFLELLACDQKIASKMTMVK
jgi:flagellar hook assembly protein FlgD